ncbi:MAG: hypothetical protein PHV56_05795 [Clostridia bacterium]|nr:hypothetical protein [Clostridia bacterium]
MKVLIKLKYQILLIPLTYVFTCVFAAINYTYWKEKRIAAKMILLAILIGTICYIFVPTIAIKLNMTTDFFDSNLYYYLISVLASIYFINHQKEYIKQHVKEDNKLR